MMSYQALEKSLDFKQALPVSENWTAAADFLKIISDYCLSNSPDTIVECSSGTSSIVLSKCCQLNHLGHVYSLEHGKDFAAQTQGYLTEHLLSEYCDVIYSPLKEHDLSGTSYQWYDVDVLPKVKIDLLVIDGPPGFIQKNSRYPALPLLHDLMAEHCSVILDDAARDDEKNVVSIWLQEYPEFEFEYIDNERGCAILTR